MYDHIVLIGNDGYAFGWGHSLDHLDDIAICDVDYYYFEVGHQCELSTFVEQVDVTDRFRRF